MVKTQTYKPIYPDVSELLSRANAIVQEHGCASSLTPEEGTIQRLGTTKKPYGKDFAAILHFDRPASVSFCNYHADAEWHVEMLTPESIRSTHDETLLRERIHETKRKRLSDQQALRNRAALNAKAMYSSAHGCTEHPYLVRKQIPFVPGLRISSDNRIIVPMYKSDGQLVSLQFIDSDGGKRFLPHGDCTGAYFPIAGSSPGKSPLLICEGLATAISLNIHTGYDVACAFSAGNLKPVAVAMRIKFPSRKIILCADNDIGGVVRYI